MKNAYLIVLLVIILGCKDQSDVKIGNYKFVKPSYVQLGYLYLTRGVNSCFIGSDIVLNKDSTFIYKTCGNIMTGKWTNRSDSLFLEVTTNRWRIDSLNKFGFNGTWPKIPSKPIGFQVSNDYLIRIHKLNNGKRVIEQLRYDMP